jgi:hypothetical protein
MRFFVTAAVLAGSWCVIAQTTDVPPPVQKPLVMPQAPNHRPGIRRTAPPGRAPGSAKTATVPPSTPVVTLKGVCKDLQAKTPCETVITREELDRFANASPDVSKAARGREAVQYARALAFSALAEQQGLAKDPAVAKELDAQIKLVRMRILANAFLQNLQPKATSVAESDIQKYYQEHQDQYERFQVLRLAVPVEVPTESGRHLDLAAAKSEMEELRRRAVAGEDFNRLQQDAYTHLHIQATPPPVDVMTLRRGSVQGDEAKAFDLSPGEISAVLDSPAAFVVMKLESKGAMPIESVHQEIEAALRRDGLQNEVSKRTKSISAQFNLQYFEMRSQPDIFGPAVTIPVASRGSIPPTSTDRP